MSDYEKMLEERRLQEERLRTERRFQEDRLRSERIREEERQKEEDLRLERRREEDRLIEERTRQERRDYEDRRSREIDKELNKTKKDDKVYTNPNDRPASNIFDLIGKKIVDWANSDKTNESTTELDFEQDGVIDNTQESDFEK